MQFDKEKCVGSTCSICVDACPARAIKSIKQNGLENQPTGKRKVDRNLFKEAFTLKESQCTIISDKQEAIEAAKESIKRNYLELELYVRANPKFLYTLTPIPAPEKPLVAKLMA